MENNQQQILAEIKSLMASVRLQLEELDAKIAQWQQMSEPEEIIDVTSVIDLDIDDDMPVSLEPMSQEVVVEEDLPVDDDLPSETDDDLPFFDVPEEVLQPVQPTQPVQEVATILNDEHMHKEKHAVIDVMTQHYAWRSAMPGTPVKDIRGAIALMDRVLFINTLFGTDPMAFQDALTQINQMQTLDQVVEYLAATHPEWDFDSETVYSFMMAVRRKVNA